MGKGVDECSSVSTDNFAHTPFSHNKVGSKMGDLWSDVCGPPSYESPRAELREVSVDAWFRRVDGEPLWTGGFLSLIRTNGCFLSVMFTNGPHGDGEDALPSFLTCGLPKRIWLALSSIE